MRNGGKHKTGPVKKYRGTAAVAAEGRVSEGVSECCELVHVDPTKSECERAAPLGMVCVRVRGGTMKNNSSRKKRGKRGCTGPA